MGRESGRGARIGGRSGSGGLRRVHGTIDGCGAGPGDTRVSRRHGGSDFRWIRHGCRRLGGYRIQGRNLLGDFRLKVRRGRRHRWSGNRWIRGRGRIRQGPEHREGKHEGQRQKKCSGDVHGGRSPGNKLHSTCQIKRHMLTSWRRRRSKFGCFRLFCRLRLISSAGHAVCKNWGKVRAF